MTSTSTSVSRGRRARTALAALTALSVGCGVPTGPESFEAIDGADVPNRLDETTTTTTTTTLPPTTTTTTLPDQPAATTSTTSEPEPATESVRIFFLSRGELRSQESEVLAPKTANDLILLLEAGPAPGPASDLLDTEIPQGLIDNTSTGGGVLTIELNDTVFRRIPERDQREAIAQMVLTFLNNLAGVGQAVFTIEGERLIVPLGNRESSDEPVSRDDYANMLVDSDPDAAPDETAQDDEVLADPNTADTDPDQ